MKIRSIIFIISTLGVIQGCVSQRHMPDEVYLGLGSLSAGVEQCYSSDSMEVKQVAETQEAIKYVLNTWVYDIQKMNKIIDEQKANIADCKEVELISYKLVSKVNSRRESNRESVKQLNSSIENNRVKNTFCNKIGTQTVCSTY